MKDTDRNAGKGGWKKPMLNCNGLDMPTSNWSFIARELVKSNSWRKANDGESWCVFNKAEMERHRLAVY